MIKKVKKEALTTAHYALLYEADPSKKMVADYITRGICFDYQTEELQGILVLLPTHPRTLEIVNIAVSEESRGRGIGQELLHFAIDFAKKEKYDYLEIGTGSTGFQQLYLYQKVGFRMTHIEPDFFIQTTFPVQEMLFFNAQELVTTHLAVESYNWVELLVLLERRSD